MSSKATPKPGPKGIPAPKLKAVAVAATAPTSEVAGGEDAGADRAVALKLRELVVRVAEVTGGKKKGVKEIVEATLAALGDALAKGEELNLPGVGKVRVAKSVDREGRSMMTLKVRGVGAPKAKEPKEALAEPEEAV
ncbi:MAG: HU family DNA-binding protein [Pseudotabrizicola sp.]|uniref:HU family DNA-binding protein n=1 Tax=Pseudotabrizicola sp. TaxID=2939647 RepID=UPI00272FD452|nr:HU family DNA-binding protein [Pseudotabrizicola sp.]MDP2081638.1 HU family DNA-binding protein [Pseudotabrizicola sp.]MDZ7575074.1 HU family DNA-binding protein [Pseudotabrizicola sp.]